MKKIWNIFTTVIVVIVVILAVLMVGIRLVGVDVYSVLSGSMEPTYHTGSLVYVKETDYRLLEVGDPITFMLDENTLATHRIVEIIPDEEDPEVLRFRTKGDANEAADGGLVHYRNVIGKVFFTVPYLGYLSDFLQHPPGTYIAIAFGALLLAMIFLEDLLKEQKKSAEKTDPAEGEKAGSENTGTADTEEKAGSGEQETVIIHEENDASQSAEKTEGTETPTEAETAETPQSFEGESEATDEIRKISFPGDRS